MSKKLNNGIVILKNQLFFDSDFEKFFELERQKRSRGEIKKLKNAQLEKSACKEHESVV